MSNATTANAMVVQQNKRLACDRCRAQKLKCVRPDLSGACERCTTASARCSVGNPGRPGRPPTVQRSSNKSLDNRMHSTTTTFRQDETIPTTVALDFQSNRTNNETPPQVSSISMNPPSTVAHVRGSSQPNNFDEQNLFNLLEDSVMEDIDFSALGSSYPIPSDNAKIMGDSWQQPENFPNGASQNAQFFPMLEPSGTILSNEMSPKSSLASHMAPDDAHMNQASFPGTLFPPWGDSAAARNQRMQQLMQLGSLMYELQNNYSHDEDAVRPISSDTFPTEFTGKVLHAATSFLKSLYNFLDRRSSVSTNSTTSLNRSSASDIADMGHKNHSLSLSTYGLSSNNASRASSSTYASSESVDPPVRRVYVADKPATLQLIACYLRLLQLYLLLNTAILEYVHSTEPDFRRLQPIWNDLRIGDAPLHPFADFQIKLVLQVAMHTLEEIEGALGLPKGCRMSQKSTTEGSGILGANVTAHFIEMCMSEVATGAEEGRAAISRLREIQKRLKDLLDGPALF